MKTKSKRIELPALMLFILLVLAGTAKAVTIGDGDKPATKPNDVPNTVNCPNGICNGTKVFLKIDRVTAP